MLIDMNMKSIADVSKQLASLFGGKAGGWRNRIKQAIYKNELRCYRFQASCNAKIWLKEKDVVNWIDDVCGADDRQIVLSTTEVAEARQYDE